MHNYAHCPQWLCRHFGLHFGEIVAPVIIFIDCYYRTEWFEMHTSWGKAILSPLFKQIGVDSPNGH